MPQYDFVTNQITVNAGATVLALTARPGRVTLVVTVASAAHPNRISLLATTANFAWYQLVSPAAQEFVYRDFGPLVEQPLWLRGDIDNVTCTVTEVYRIPGG